MSLKVRKNRARTDRCESPGLSPLAFALGAVEGVGCRGDLNVPIYLPTPCKSLPPTPHTHTLFVTPPSRAVPHND